MKHSDLHPLEVLALAAMAIAWAAWTLARALIVPLLALLIAMGSPGPAGAAGRAPSKPGGEHGNKGGLRADRHRDPHARSEGSFVEGLRCLPVKVASVNHGLGHLHQTPGMLRQWLKVIQQRCYHLNRGRSRGKVQLRAVSVAAGVRGAPVKPFADLLVSIAKEGKLSP